MGGDGYQRGDDRPATESYHQTKAGSGHIYNRYSYDKEKQMALETWERKLNSIINDTEIKVITIQAGRRK